MRSPWFVGSTFAVSTERDLNLCQLPKTSSKLLMFKWFDDFSLSNQFPNLILNLSSVKKIVSALLLTGSSGVRFEKQSREQFENQPSAALRARLEITKTFAPFYGYLLIKRFNDNFQVNYFLQFPAGACRRGICLLRCSERKFQLQISSDAKLLLDTLNCTRTWLWQIGAQRTNQNREFCNRYDCTCTLFGVRCFSCNVSA